jgi:hypothetical protein
MISPTPPNGAEKELSPNLHTSRDTNANTARNGHKSLEFSFARAISVLEPLIDMNNRQRTPIISTFNRVSQPLPISYTLCHSPLLHQPRRRMQGPGQHPQDTPTTARWMRRCRERYVGIAGWRPEDPWRRSCRLNHGSALPEWGGMLQSRPRACF